MNKKEISTILIAVVLVLTGVGLRLKSKVQVAGTKTEARQIRGIILPHHALANEIISQSVGVLPDDYERIVIIGPNHFYTHAYTVTTTNELLNYQVDNEFISHFSQTFPNTLVSSEVITKEHGITTPLATLMEKYPESQLIPLAISPQYTSSELKTIAKFIADNTTDKTLFVLSLDFSHENMLLEGMQKNTETIQTIETFDYDTLLKYKDDHLDSPVATSLFLQIMQYKNSVSWTLLFTSHGALLEDDPLLQGTSYVVGIFQ